MKFKSNRRLFLKGVGGYMLSLPILEIMLNDNGNAYADGTAIQSNYLYTFQGESCGHPRNNTILYRPPSYGALRNALSMAPSHKGNIGIAPFDELGVLDDINVISNLYINSNRPGTPGNIQVKGNSHEQSPIMHRSSSYAVNTGYGCPKDVNVWLNYRRPGGKHSTDQALYDALGKKGKLMNFALEKYEDGWAQTASMRNGYLQTPQKDLGKAFDDLFGGFVPPTEQTTTVDEVKANRRSILNLVLEDHKRLQKKLGHNDRLIVEQHMQSIRDLEKSIEEITIVENARCTVPQRMSENHPIEPGTNYGGEKERALLFNQLITLAMACGVSRVGCYTLLRHKAYVSPVDYIPNVTNAEAQAIMSDVKYRDFHEIGHNGTAKSLEIWEHMVRWISGTYGDLVKRFKEVQVGDGSLLDHSFIMMGMHQGIGLSLESSSTNHVHSFENMCYLQAGGKALGAKTGRHIDGQRKHPVAVANSAAEAMGLSINFGEISDKVKIT